MPALCYIVSYSQKETPYLDAFCVHEQNSESHQGNGVI